MTNSTSPTTQSGSGQFFGEYPELLQPHRDNLHSSGISDEVIKERRYESVFGKKRLNDTGFSPAQQRPVGILIPLYAPDGSPAGWQYRPDNPRVNAKGKPIKYENPVGGSIRLDCPPRCAKA